MYEEMACLIPFSKCNGKKSNRVSVEYLSKFIELHIGLIPSRFATPFPILNRYKTLWSSVHIIANHETS